MSKDFQNVKGFFMSLYVNNRRYLTEEEIDNLSDEQKKNLETDNVKNQRYILEPMELTEDEFKVYLEMKQVDQLNELNNKLKIIKNIIIFWFILTLIGLAILLLFISMFL